MAFTSRSSTRIVCAFMLSEALMFGVDWLLHGPGERAWPQIAAFALTGFSCLIAGVRARLQPPRLVVERETGRELIRRPEHLAFLFWGLLFVGLAILGNHMKDS